jgi:hypothetical protein
VGKGTCEKELKKYNEAIETFTKGITTDMGHICLEKRGITFFDVNKFDEALRDL